MADLIPLAELLAEIDREIKRVPACTATLQRARSIAMTIPTVDAEPVVHARWKHKDNSRNVTRIGDFEEWYECSACFGSAEWMSERCPHCGARMGADAPERAGKDGRDE